MTVRLILGDCRDVLKTLPDASVDSIVTDPPYELTSGKKGGTGAGGFMGLAWDSTGVAFDAATWLECLRVLKPGGHMLAFSGTRTYHRMVCAIEDAGFEIRDQIAWVYSSGFPKSHNGEWGGTALKPAHEPICMARAPLIGTVEANWREYGTGALNIDGCRVGTTVETWPGSRSYAPGQMQPGHVGSRQVTGDAPAGRWPANLIHDGSDEVLAAFPESDGQAGAVRGTEPSKTGDANCYGTFRRVKSLQPRGDTGSAARFFYCSKASPSDRGPDNTHPTVKPTDLMRYLCRLVTPPGGVVLDPFMGSGSTLKAAELEGFSAIGIELSAEYIEIARRRITADAPLFASVVMAA